MVLVPRPLALAGGLALTLLGATAAGAAAPTHTLRLTATRMASHAHGTVLVTQTAADAYTLTITVGGLPRPATLPTKVTRHVYIAWVLDPHSTRTHLLTQGAIPLQAGHGDAYRGRGVVKAAHLGRILVTAEVSTTVRRPALPPEGVLISGM